MTSIHGLQTALQRRNMNCTPSKVTFAKIVGKTVRKFRLKRKKGQTNALMLTIKQDIIIT